MTNSGSSRLGVCVGVGSRKLGRAFPNKQQVRVHVTCQTHVCHLF